MKKLFAFVAILGVLALGLANTSFAQQENATSTDAIEQAGTVSDSAAQTVEEPAVDSAMETMAEETDQMAEEGEKEVMSLHQSIKKNFIDGDPRFMSLVLICLILGLALCIERIIYLNLSSTNSQKLLGNVSDALNSKGVEAAKDVCRSTSGPVASIFYEGLERADGKIEEVEKSIEQYGSVQMGLLEKGLSWISLFIAIAPMLGFMGTVIGMIQAFNDIAEANTMNAQLVANGIKVALITTVSGLIVAILLQILYNYILSKIDSIVVDMEESSIEFVDMVYKFKLSGKDLTK